MNYKKQLIKDGKTIKKTILKTVEDRKNLMRFVITRQELKNVLYGLGEPIEETPGYFKPFKKYEIYSEKIPNEIELEGYGFCSECDLRETKEIPLWKHNHEYQTVGSLVEDLKYIPSCDPIEGPNVTLNKMNILEFIMRYGREEGIKMMASNMFQESFIQKYVDEVLEQVNKK